MIAWIASQPWCTGDVGMIGISWGGFNGLQIAARQPPELKAVISVYSTDDRYEDELHHQGGCVMSYTLTWASTMFAYNARPPDPRHVGDRWREMWFERIENDTPWVEEWLRHPRKDEFWKHGSVRENYDDIQCPVYMVGRLVRSLRWCGAQVSGRVLRSEKRPDRSRGLTDTPMTLLPSRL